MNATTTNHTDYRCPACGHTVECSQGKHADNRLVRCNGDARNHCVPCRAERYLAKAS